MPTMAYYVYLLASKKHGTLYLGVTNDLVRRAYEHRTKAVKGISIWGCACFDRCYFARTVRGAIS
jgi:GIY-YIG catalytic domain